VVISRFNIIITKASSPDIMKQLLLGAMEFYGLTPIITKGVCIIPEVTRGNTYIRMAVLFRNRTMPKEAMLSFWQIFLELSFDCKDFPKTNLQIKRINKSPIIRECIAQIKSD